MNDILLVEDDKPFAESLMALLDGMGRRVTHAENIGEARSALAQDDFEWMILDLMLPDGSGLELLDARRQGRVVVMTGDPGIADSVRALQGPGMSYLTKPISMKDLRQILGERDSEALEIEELVGDSTPMQQLRDEVQRVAERNVPVFIHGESGTGKELVAAALHRLSGRTGPFVAVNCAAISPELLPSQLFGHEKGAFTGAQKRHAGHFEQASGGTLFLDEIFEMPIDQQPGLLRVLESSRITRVGGSEEIAIDARVLSAGNRDPKQAVADGRLREDLFFRLSVFPIRVPPLRERGDDVVQLARHFLGQLNAEYDTAMQLSDAAAEALAGHTWPGNVRELKHVVQRAYILADPGAAELDVEARHLTPLDVSSAGQMPVGLSIREMEKALIEKTLQAYEGDKPAAARVLGISLRTLYNRLNEYSDEPDA